jgi:hypothetical protein
MTGAGAIGFTDQSSELCTLPQLARDALQRVGLARARGARIVIALREVLGELLDDLFIARGVAGDLDS